MDSSIFSYESFVFYIYSGGLNGKWLAFIKSFENTKIFKVYYLHCINIKILEYMYVSNIFKRGELVS